MWFLVEFVIPFLISAAGSAPVGMITLTIIQKSISKDKHAARLMSFGATLPEFIYTWIAIWGFSHLEVAASVRWYLEFATIFIFLGLAYYFYTKKEHFDDQQPTKRIVSNNFMEGFIIASLNMLVVPFWIGVLLWLQTYDIAIQSNRSVFLFSLASALGAMVIFLAYAELGAYLVKRIAEIARIANRIIALVFLVLAVVMTIRFLL